MQNNQPNPDDFQYSHGRHIASDAIRGFVAGLRGVLEAKQMQREATNEREQRIAQEAYRQRALDLQEAQMRMTGQHQQNVLEADTQHKQELTDIQSRLADLEVIKEQNLKGMNEKDLQSRVDMFNQEMEIRTKEAENKKLIAEMGFASQERMAAANQKFQEKVTQVQQELDARKLDIEERLAKSKIDTQEKLTALEELKALGALKSVDPDHAKNVETFYNLTNRSKAYQDLISARTYYLTGMKAYMETVKGNSVGDFLMVVALARIIEPTSVVREGEFHSLQKTLLTVPQSVQVSIRKFLDEGGFFDQESRRQLAEAIRDQYNTRVQGIHLGELQNLKNTAEAMNVQDSFFLEFPQQENTIDAIVQAGDPTLGWTMVSGEPPASEAVSESESDALKPTADAVQAALEAGQDIEAVKATLKKDFMQTGAAADEDQADALVEKIMAAVTLQQPPKSAEDNE